MVDYCTVEDVRAEGRFKATETAYDDLLNDLITRVSAMIDKETGRLFGVSSDTTKYFDLDNVNGRDLELFDVKDQLLSVTSVTNGDGTSISTGNLILLPRNGERYHTVRLTSASGVSWSTGTDEYIEIAGKWGYSLTIPEAIREAAIEGVIHIFNQAKSLGGDRDVQISSDGMVIRPSAMPANVQRIMKLYRKRI